MSGFKHRVVMIDMARLLERWEHYQWLMPWLKEWGYNTIHLRIADDQGCRLGFASHPKLADRQSLSAEQMRAFVELARRNGLGVLPEIECFGHAAYISKKPDYSHLGVDGAEDFNALDPEHPEVLSVLHDLLEDLAGILDYPVIHVGLDEVNLHVIPRFRDADESVLEKVFATHISRVHQAVRDVGRRPAMWGDHLLKTPGLAKKMKKDVLIFDWHYDADPDPRTMDFFCDKGFELWGAPSTMHWGCRVVSHSSQLQNIRKFSASGMTRRRKGVSGMVNTVWCPWRYLPGAMDYPTALGGHLFSEAAESEDFAAEFSRGFYGLSTRDAAECGRAIETLHAIAPWHTLFDTIVFGKSDHAGMRFTREESRAGGALARQAEGVAGIFKRLLGKARRNADRMEDVYLSARILQRVGQFGEGKRHKSDLPGGEGLYQRCMRSWQRCRDSSWGKLANKFRPAENVSYVLSRLT